MPTTHCCERQRGAPAQEAGTAPRNGSDLLRRHVKPTNRPTNPRFSMWKNLLRRSGLPYPTRLGIRSDPTHASARARARARAARASSCAPAHPAPRRGPTPSCGTPPPRRAACGMQPAPWGSVVRVRARTTGVAAYASIFWRGSWVCRHN
eukprot:scaffold1574_cov373-Prasinococcus_capsulatus_cf.AAC.10